jgi:hypothetical protein
MKPTHDIINFINITLDSMKPTHDIINLINLTLEYTPHIKTSVVRRNSYSGSIISSHAIYCGNA